MLVYIASTPSAYRLFNSYFVIYSYTIYSLSCNYVLHCKALLHYIYEVTTATKASVAYDTAIECLLPPIDHVHVDSGCCYQLNYH